jgi:hypothetical protein
MGKYEDRKRNRRAKEFLATSLSEAAAQDAPTPPDTSRPAAPQAPAGRAATAPQAPAGRVTTGGPAAAPAAPAAASGPVPAGAPADAAPTTERRRRRRREKGAEATTRSRPRRTGTSDAEPSTPRRWRWVCAWALGTVTVCVGVALGTGAFDREPDRRWLLASAVMLVVATLIGLGHRPAQGTRGRNSVPAVAVFLATTFTIGAMNSVIIDGRPVPATSSEAASHRLIVEMEDDINQLVEIDELLGLDEAESRARNRELGPAIADAQRMSSKWAQVEVASIPTGELISPAQRLSTASYAAVEALMRKEQLLGTSDPKTTAELSSFRQTLITETVAAGKEISAVGPTYGVDVRLGAPTVRE